MRQPRKPNATKSRPYRTTTLQFCGSTTQQPYNSPTLRPTNPTTRQPTTQPCNPTTFMHAGEMKKSDGIEPTVVSYSAALSACEKGGQWELALELLELMRSQMQVSELVS